MAARVTLFVSVFWQRNDSGLAVEVSGYCLVPRNLQRAARTGAIRHPAAFQNLAVFLLPMSSQYNHVHVVLQNLDLKALPNLVE